ncbi:MAG: type II toxin-antitoxin system Phd/YefM family antitoxin [Candidatus Limnocylindrales bacterium]
MRTVSAIEVRKSFGRILDDAASGERIVIERAGQPLAALVPLSDLEHIDPEKLLVRKLNALDSIAQMARRARIPADFDAVASVREARDARARPGT